MQYYTLKLYTPVQVCLVPSEAQVLEIIPPGQLHDRDHESYNDAPCPSLLIGVSTDADVVQTMELVPIRVTCTAINPETQYDVKNGHTKYFDSGRINSLYTNDMDVFSEANKMSHVGKFTICRNGLDVSYLVSCETRPQLNQIPISISTVSGDSSAGFADGALPRAII